ncbi:hypothetical protein [Candidatus Amarolinea dominans]|uniref:hypothetical protein n=1 Tax=Candidatus Amarolinea dominans TaxID=3140696 RepID=UPI00313740E2|nr:hypothetical protein [Anaerolineae bacterium]
MKRKSGSQWSKIGPIVVAVIILLLALASPAFAQGGDTLGVGLSLGAICLIVIPIVAVYVWMILWIRKDAAQRGQSGCMPIALVLIFGPIGLVIWLLMRPKDQV